MSKKNQMSHNVCYAKPLSNRAVPLGFNIKRFRFSVCVLAHSDVSKCRIFFYRYHGMYWYSLRVWDDFGSRGHVNSISFISIRNATFDCAYALRSIGFVIDTPRNFRELSRIDEQERRSVSAEQGSSWRF